mmetsp:Transcript_122041/g.390257  ORF Transcript_122041/g.390257 Transcript_122041/m.390257 type:complete len:300 (+) Transcript_122041:284-1183(+)
MMEQQLPALQIAPPTMPANVHSNEEVGNPFSFFTKVQYPNVKSVPMTSAPQPKDGTAAMPCTSGGRYLKGTRMEPPKKPQVMAETRPAVVSAGSTFFSFLGLSGSSPSNLRAIFSLFTMMRTPINSTTKAAMLRVMSPTGSAISPGPKAPHVNEVKIAEQDHTACAVARPTRGMAMKLKRAAITNTAPPAAPAGAKRKAPPVNKGTINDVRNTPTATNPLKRTGSSAGPEGNRETAGKEPLKKADSPAKTKPMVVASATSVTKSPAKRVTRPAATGDGCCCGLCDRERPAKPARSTTAS